MPACVNSFIEPPRASLTALAPPVLNLSAWYTIYDAISGCQVGSQAAFSVKPELELGERIVQWAVVESLLTS